MSILHDAFQAIKDAIANAFNFAEPAAALQEAEHHFMNLVADEFQALLERVEKIEQHLFGGPGVVNGQVDIPPVLTPGAIVNAALEHIEQPVVQPERPAEAQPAAEQPAEQPDASYNEFM